jgi:hypothetical protein
MLIDMPPYNHLNAEFDSLLDCSNHIYAKFILVLVSFFVEIKMIACKSCLSFADMIS